MPYSPSQPGLRGSVTRAVQNMLIAQIPDLNTALAANTATMSLLAVPFTSNLVGSTCVVRGETPLEWDPSEGAIRIFISHAHPMNGLSRETAITYSQEAAKMQTFHTFISMVLHPMSYQYKGQGTDQTQATLRNDALAIMEDWLWAVTSDHAYMQAYTQTQSTPNITGNIHLVLDTNYFNAAPEYDRLKDCYARMIHRDQFARGPSAQQAMWGVHCIHTGKIG